MFNEINKVSEVCVVNARNVIYNSSLSRLMYNLSVCMRLLTKWCCVVEFEPLKFPPTTWEANWYWSPLANRFKCFMGVYSNGGYDKPANGQDDISSLACSDKLGGVSVTMSTDLIYLISTLIFSIKCWDWFKMLINASHSLTVLPPSSPNLRQYSKLSFYSVFYRLQLTGTIQIQWEKYADTLNISQNYKLDITEQDKLINGNHSWPDPARH